MKKIFSCLIILIFLKHSYALECIACEATDTDETCELSYKCPKGSKYCETLVSKVEGSYSVVMSCSTEEKCDAEPILKDGLDECNHDEDNTECYTCCKDDDCNTLEAALKKLPDDIFETEKPAKKAKKSKSKKENDEEEEDTEETAEESEDEEDENVEKSKSKDKKSKDKKLKNKQEEPETKEETDEENAEEPKELEKDEVEPKEAEKDEVEPEMDESDKEVKSSNETTAKIANESPENGTVIDQTNIDNNTVVATNITENAIEERTGNNGDAGDLLKPLDSNIQEIDKTLNEIVDEVDDLAENFDNSGNAENIGNVENTGVNTENVDPKADITGMEETKVENGVEYNAPQNPENELPLEDITNGESNIMSEGENANEGGEQHELVDAPSSSTKYQISEILLAAFSILILIQLY